MTGYKRMLQDRMPCTMDLALKWCKAKGRWIEYVYDNTIKRYPKSERSRMVKIVLGIKQPMTRKQIYTHIRYSELKNVTQEQVNNIPKEALFNSFGDTIDYEKLSREDPDMYFYWKRVEDWVNWFKKHYKYIENAYKISTSQGKDECIIKAEIMRSYHLNGKLADYLIKSFK